MRFAEQHYSTHPDLMCGTFTIGDLNARWATFPDIAGLYRPFIHDPRDHNVSTNPLFLVEVTSDASERIDRGLKVELYRTLPLLESYVIISHRRPHLEVHRRGNRNAWAVTEATTGVVQITANIVVDVDELFRPDKY